MVLTESNHAPGGGRSKTPLKSPRPQGLLSPNDDEREKQAARAKRAALEKRRSLANDMEEAAPLSQVRTSQALGHGQIVELYSNCIKLASENKINAKNSWSLQLIDHISDLVKPNKDDGDQTNFQKASCTLDAGVKIYSYRVDSVYTETFKVLGGVNRSTNEEEGAASGDKGEFEEGEEGEDGGAPKKKAYNAAATLESSFDAINLKKMENSINVDPLFHKTSAQFDEGGARGLLLNNLSVLNGCELVFDSMEVPGRARAPRADDAPGSGAVDLGGIREQIREAAAAAAAACITPGLDEMRALLGERAEGAVVDYSTAVADAAGAAIEVAPPSPPGAAPGPDDDNDGGGGYFGGFDDDMGDDGIDEEDDFAGAAGGRVPDAAPGGGGGGLGVLLGADALDWIAAAGAAGSSRAGAWAGASHWRYNKPKDSAAPSLNAEDREAATAATRSRAKKDAIDFEDPPAIPQGAFDLARGVKEINLASSSASTSATLLPADLHYKPTELAQLFFRPRSACVRRGGEGGPEASTSGDDYGGMDFEMPLGGDYYSDDDEAAANPATEWGGEGGEGEGGEGSEDLVSAPRQVSKVSVNYARASKQVDVKALKETLWDGLGKLGGGAPAAEAGAGQPLSFQELVRNVPDDCPAGRPEDVSVHLCFICLLHLANENGLAIKGRPEMDELDISIAA